MHHTPLAHLLLTNPVGRVTPMKHLAGLRSEESIPQALEAVMPFDPDAFCLIAHSFSYLRGNRNSGNTH